MSGLMSSRGFAFTEEAKIAMTEARRLLSADAQIVVAVTIYPDLTCLLAIGGDPKPDPKALADSLDELDFCWYANADGFRAALVWGG